MGTILIAGTPAAYVDASSAWSFPQRTQRLIVMCGGMFFESLVFVPCVFIWAFASSPMLQSCAWQLVVMTSVVTILFNANPLMKFDGYFILSELLGIQNLRPAADAQVKRLLTATLLGLRHGDSGHSAGRKLILVAYGISATIYRFVLVISIATVVALKIPVAGLALAVFHIVTTVGTGSVRLARYLLTSPETASVRARSRLTAAAVFLGLPLAVSLIPVPFGVVTQGIVGAETEHFINVTSPGTLNATSAVAGTSIDASTPLVQLTNDQTVDQLRIAEASLREAILHREIARAQGPVQAAQRQSSVRELRQQVAEHTRQVSDLTVSSPASGHLVQLIPHTDRGRYLPAGHPLAVIVDGRPLLRTWVTEDQLGSLQTAPGTPVSFRVPGRSTSTWTGQILSIRPGAEQTLHETAVTHLAGGSLLIDPATGRPLVPVFQIDIQPASGAVELTEHGSRVSLNLNRRRESLATWAARRCMRFVQKLLTA